MSAHRQTMPSISPCETHHLGLQYQPLYKRRFDQVLPFHEPGLAPVRLNGQAWHIRMDGGDAYPYRYERSFGFYYGVAAVIYAGDWFHIMPDGQPLYAARYAFAGNYQEYFCVVCDAKGRYFHIDLQGNALYSSCWRYCGDFREGIAVVQRGDGLSTHINASGDPIHGHWFIDLDVFHKGFARARDEKGWFHIGRTGQPIYSQRYAQLEPFYNGCSRVETQDGELLVIDETGKVVRELRSARRDPFSELSADMVGYWRTLALSASAEIRLLDHLPLDTVHLAKILEADPLRLERLLCALAELGLVTLEAGQWLATEKGKYLCTSHAQTLQPAALEYGGDLLDRWRFLPAIVRGASISQDIFDSVASDQQRCQAFHKMLESYALHDYPAVLDLLGIEPEDVVFDAAGGSGALSRLMAKRFPEATIICGDYGPVLANHEGVQTIDFNLFDPWPMKANKVLLTRVLHDWDDNQATEILRHARETLQLQGEVVVVEMLLAECGFGGALSDLHLLAVTGGKERCLSEYEGLFTQAGLSLLSATKGPGLVSVLRAEIAHE